VIEARWRQRSFADGFLREAVDEFWDDWMRAVDRVLDDDDLVATVYEALRKRCPQSRTRGRLGFPAEVVLRLLLLKHLRTWSFVILEREVRTNLLYREFTPCAAGRGRMPRRWGGWPRRWGRRWWPRSISAWWRSRTGRR
jgi:IS5 family transposase